MLPIGNSYRVIVTRHYSWVYCSKYKRPPCGSSEFVAFWDSIKNVGGASDVFFPDSVVLPGGELGWGALCPSQAHQGHRHRQQQDEVCPCGPSRCREEGCWTWRLALAGSALINLTNCYSVVWYSAAIFFFIFGSILGIPRHFFGCLLGPDLDFFSHVLLEHADWEEQQSYCSLFWPKLTEVPNLFSCLTDVFVLVGTDYWLFILK